MGGFRWIVGTDERCTPAYNDRYQRGGAMRLSTRRRLPLGRFVEACGGLDAVWATPKPEPWRGAVRPPWTVCSRSVALAMNPITPPAVAKKSARGRTPQVTMQRPWKPLRPRPERP